MKRIRTKYSNSGLAKAWATESLHPDGEVFHGHSMVATHSKIFSWGPHFCIAEVRPEVVLYTERGYSPSTSKHKMLVRTAIGYGNPDILYVPTLDDNAQPKDWIRMKLDAVPPLLPKIKRARENKPWRIIETLQLCNQAALYAETFGLPLPSRGDIPADELEELIVVEVFKAKADGNGLQIPDLHECYKK